ncbi:hypothetical protein ACJJTC_000900 [Scirpophaga incertulas]
MCLYKGYLSAAAAGAGGGANVATRELSNAYITPILVVVKGFAKGAKSHRKGSQGVQPCDNAALPMRARSSAREQAATNKDEQSRARGPLIPALLQPPARALRTYRLHLPHNFFVTSPVIESI